jgi:hypothetical protein
VLSAADPANVLGTVLPGTKVARVSGSRILYRDGLAIGTSIAGQIELFVELDPVQQRAATRLLALDPGVRFLEGASSGAGRDDRLSPCWAWSVRAWECGPISGCETTVPPSLAVLGNRLQHQPIGLKGKTMKVTFLALAPSGCRWLCRYSAQDMKSPASTYRPPSSRTRRRAASRRSTTSLLRRPLMSSS